MLWQPLAHPSVYTGGTYLLQQERPSKFQKGSDKRRNRNGTERGARLE